MATSAVSSSAASYCPASRSSGHRARGSSTAGAARPGSARRAASRSCRYGHQPPTFANGHTTSSVMTAYAVFVYKGEAKKLKPPEIRAMSEKTGRTTGSGSQPTPKAPGKTKLRVASAHSRASRARAG